MFPDRVGTFDSYVGYRLSEPLGYWNALSIFAVIGAAVAVGLAARGRSIVQRSLSAASLVLLLPVTLLTFGRGAWIALAAGLAVAIAVDPRRLQFVTTLLVVAPWPALALWRVYESPNLTTDYSALADASNEGRNVALTIAAVAVASAVATAAFSLLSERVTVQRGVRRPYGGALALAVVVIVASAITAYCHRPPGPGNPRTISVPANAVPSHLAHGDSVGPCPSGN